MANKIFSLHDTITKFELGIKGTVFSAQSTSTVYRVSIRNTRVNRFKTVEQYIVQYRVQASAYDTIRKGKVKLHSFTKQYIQ